MAHPSDHSFSGKRQPELPPAAWVAADKDVALDHQQKAQRAQALPVILGGGVDTIYFSFDIEVSDAIWARLEAEQRVAQILARERNADHCPEWLHARIAPTGARGGYKFLIETPYWSIKLLKDIPHRPPIYVEMRAYGLHTIAGGPRTACELACLYLRQVLLADQPSVILAGDVTLEQARCSRIDLYMDWQGGWTPDAVPASATGAESDASGDGGGSSASNTSLSQEWDERVFIKRPHVAVTRHSADNALTGYVIGKGAIQARIYHKSLQARRSHLDWYLEWLTQKNGSAYDPDLPVWRVEFQLLRAGVKGFTLYARPAMDDPEEAIEAELDSEDLPRIGSVAKAFRWADQLFRYLTTRWLRVVTPTSDPNRGRWPEQVTWTLLREGFAAQLRPPGALGSADNPLNDNRLRLVRAQRYASYQRLLDRMSLGLLDSLEAMDTDPGAALHAYTAYMTGIANRVVARQQAAAARQAVRQGQQGQQGKQRQARQTPNATAQPDEQSSQGSDATTNDGPDVQRGMGGRWSSLVRAERREQLLAAALGALTNASVTRLTLPPPEDIGSVADLLQGSLPDLEALAQEKGGIGSLLEGKWRKVYKAHCPRGVFTRQEMNKDGAPQTAGPLWR